MAFIDWSLQLRVGVGAFDSQHQRLIGLVNELHAGMPERKGLEVVGRVLDGLEEYVRTHFTNEERAFDLFKYPDAVAHREQHHLLASRVQELHAKHQAGSLIVSIDVLQLLAGWLRTHIMQSDRKYGPFLAGKVV